MPNSALPDHLKGKLHNDYIWPLCYIPRSWTSFKLKQPPKLLFGYRTYDYTEYKYSDGKRRKGAEPTQRNKWAFAITFPFHVTFTIGNTGLYMRLGCRYDTIDEYYTIPAFAFKKIDGALYNTHTIRVTYRGNSRLK